MVNPFDRNFFKFFIGFVLILLLSFAMLYFVETYSRSIDSSVASAKL